MRKIQERKTSEQDSHFDTCIPSILMENSLSTTDRPLLLSPEEADVLAQTNKMLPLDSIANLPRSNALTYRETLTSTIQSPISQYITRSPHLFESQLND